MKLSLSLLFSSVFMLSAFGQSNQLSPNAEISVLTIGSGDELFDKFGHSAFRINDRNVGTDIVYGYGEYDFDTPNFYLKFAQGKLNYLISQDAFSDFYRRYVLANRTIEEQVLNLTQEEKQNLYDYLINNYKPENRRYLYDFFYDNCATRMREVVENSVQRKLAFYPPKDFEQKTFRQLIYDQTGKNNWGSFGIDLALGSVIDRKATPYEHMFLPVYIHDFFDSAKLDTSQALVKKSKVLYQRKGAESAQNFLSSPLMILGIISLLVLFITYSDYKKSKRSKWLDAVLFGTTGLIGVLMLLLWFATDHTATAQNYNLLWAFPLNFLVIGQLLKKQPNQWFKRYLKFIIIMLCLMTFHWLVGIQVFAMALIPLIIVLTVRYVFLINFYNKQINPKIQ